MFAGVKYGKRKDPKVLHASNNAFAGCATKNLVAAPDQNGRSHWRSPAKRCKTSPPPYQMPDNLVHFPRAEEKLTLLQLQKHADKRSNNNLASAGRSRVHRRHCVHALIVRGRKCEHLPLFTLFFGRISENSSKSDSSQIETSKLASQGATTFMRNTSDSTHCVLGCTLGDSRRRRPGRRARTGRP